MTRVSGREAAQLRHEQLGGRPEREQRDVEAGRAQQDRELLGRAVVDGHAAFPQRVEVAALDERLRRDERHRPAGLEQELDVVHDPARAAVAVGLGHRVGADERAPERHGAAVGVRPRIDRSREAWMSSGSGRSGWRSSSARQRSTKSAWFVAW